jgi:predicted nucleic acid-binding protein
MPGNRGKKYYWDSCLFLTWLKNEPRKPGEAEGIEEVVRLVHSNKAEIFTSVLTVTEVLESKMTDAEKTRFQDLFKRPNVVQVDVDSRVAGLAAEIRGHYLAIGAKISAPDSIHLATAIHYEADEFHTTDGGGDRKRKGDLIPLSGDVAGHKLVICTPFSRQPNLLPGSERPISFEEE